MTFAKAPNDVGAEALLSGVTQALKDLRLGDL